MAETTGNSQRTASGAVDTEEWRGVGVSYHLPAFALAVAYFAAVVLSWQQHWIQLSLALLPVVVGVIDQRFAKLRYETQRRIVGDYFSRLRHTPGTGFNPQARLIAIELDAQRPSLHARLAATLLLAAVLVIPALLTRIPEGWATAAVKYNLPDGIDGMVWAGYGALGYVLWALIWRVSASSLSTRFFTAAALRTLLGIVLGLAFSEVGGFGLEPNAATYLLVGAFAPLGFEDLAGRARKLFNADERGVERLPLGLVDGLQDQNIDLLAEVGIADIEHLATTPPPELVIKTLNPLNRVIDWVDQALLIGYVRRNVTVSRKYGIRGAIDLLVLYSDIAEPPIEETAAAAAKATLEAAAKEMGIEYHTLYMIGRGFYYDAFVDLIYRFWQGTDGQAASPPAAPSGGGGSSTAVVNPAPS